MAKPSEIRDLPRPEVTSPDQETYQRATEMAYDRVRKVLIEHQTRKLSLPGSNTLYAKEPHSTGGSTEYRVKVDPETGQITTASIARKDNKGQPTRPDCVVNFDKEGNATLFETWEREDGVKVYTTVDATGTTVTMVADNVVDNFNRQARDKARQRQRGQKPAHIDDRESGRQDQIRVELKYDPQGKIATASVATDKLAPMPFKLPFPYSDPWFPATGYQASVPGSQGSAELLPITHTLGVIAETQWVIPEDKKPQLQLLFATAINMKFTGEHPYYPIPSIAIPEQIASGARALEQLRIGTSINFAPQTGVFVKEQPTATRSGGGFRPPVNTRH